MYKNASQGRRGKLEFGNRLDSISLRREGWDRSSLRTRVGIYVICLRNIEQINIIKTKDQKDPGCTNYLSIIVINTRGKSPCKEKGVWLMVSDVPIPGCLALLLLGQWQSTPLWQGHKLEETSCFMVAWNQREKQEELTCPQWFTSLFNLFF